MASHKINTCKFYYIHTSSFPMIIIGNCDGLNLNDWTGTACSDTGGSARGEDKTQSFVRYPDTDQTCVQMLLYVRILI